MLVRLFYSEPDIYLLALATRFLLCQSQSQIAWLLLITIALLFSTIAYNQYRGDKLPLCNFFVSTCASAVYGASVACLAQCGVRFFTHVHYSPGDVQV